jgi:hypothetical protein
MFGAIKAIQHTKTVNIKDDDFFRSELLQMATIELDISDARDKVQVKYGQKKLLCKRQ